MKTSPITDGIGDVFFIDFGLIDADYHNYSVFLELKCLIPNSMKVRCLPFLIVLSLFFGLKLQAQDSTEVKRISSFMQKYIRFSDDYPQEKVYLHFDNTSYYLGETMWFKAYVVRSDRQSLSILSRVLYVELINPEGYVIETKKLKIEKGQCNGSFNLTASNYPGYFEVRAYTRYMLNFFEDNYFSRVFPIFDKPETEGSYVTKITERPRNQRIPVKRPDVKTKNKLMLMFYPEGGSLVCGLNSKVAFKATDQNGQNAVIMGDIYNSKNRKVAEINTEYLGMGAFIIQPDSNVTRAKVIFNNDEYSFDLPQPLKEGCVMNINSSDSVTLKITIQRTPHFASGQLGLSVTCRGRLYLVQNIDFGMQNAVSLNVPKKMIPSGVSQVTLFDSKGEVLSERLVFVNHRSNLKIDMTANKASFQPFDKVELSFRVSDKSEHPLPLTFSLAVRDNASSLSSPYADNILTNLLLSSDLRGYIENPGYYFESNTASRKLALELLLLTQGWRKYDWKTMTGVTPFNPQHPLEKELAAEGKITSLIRKKNLKDVEIMMILLTDSFSQRGTAKTDIDGRFGFEMKDFNGEGKLILRSKINDRQKETNIMLDRNFSPGLKPYGFNELNFTDYFKINQNSDNKTFSTIPNELLEDSVLRKLSMSEKIHVLEELVVTEKRKPVKVSVKYNVSGEMDKIKDTGDWEPASVEGFLEKLNQYFSYKTDSNGSAFTYKGKHVYFVRDDSPDLVAADIAELMNKSTADMVATENTTSTTESNTSTNSTSENQAFVQMPRFDEIESINIIEDYGSILRLFNGDPKYDPTTICVAVMHLKKKYQEEPAGIRNTTFMGYSYPKEFYSPYYGQGIVPDPKDYRRTIYWNPDVKTDNQGQATVSFYNNSTCHSMNVSAETVTENGIIGEMNK